MIVMTGLKARRDCCSIRVAARQLASVRNPNASISACRAGNMQRGHICELTSLGLCWPHGTRHEVHVHVLGVTEKLVHLGDCHASCVRLRQPGYIQHFPRAPEAHMLKAANVHKYVCDSIFDWATVSKAVHNKIFLGLPRRSNNGITRLGGSRFTHIPGGSSVFRPLPGSSGWLNPVLDASSRQQDCKQSSATLT